MAIAGIHIRAAVQQIADALDVAAPDGILPGRIHRSEILYY
jgi:hypothetical protein